LRSTLKIVKIIFEDLFWRLPYGFPYRWHCMYFSPYWRSILKIIFFRSSKKILIFFFNFFFSIFFFNFFFIFTIISIDLQNDFWEKKKLVISEIRTCDPWLTSSPLCLCATGLLWKQSKMSEYGTICVFWWWL
jgi:hypothetical protein